MFINNDVLKPNTMRPARWLRNITAAISIGTAINCGGDGGSIIDPPPPPPVEANTAPTIKLMNSPTTLKEGEEGTWKVQATDNDTTAPNQLHYIIANWGINNDTTPISGRTGTATFKHTYTAGTHHPRFIAVDQKNLSNYVQDDITVQALPPPKNTYTIKLTESTDHRQTINGGTLHVNDSTYTVQGSTVTFQRLPGPTIIWYEGPNHTNKRQVIRTDDPTQPYGNRLGFNWSRHDGVPIILPSTDLQMELFAMKDDWEAPYPVNPLTHTPMDGAEQYRLARSFGWKAQVHSGLCEDIDPTGVADGEMTISYMLDAPALAGQSFVPMREENKTLVREFFSTILPSQISTHLRYVMRGEEQSSEPSHTYVKVIAEEGLGSFGAHGESYDTYGTGCITEMMYLTPDDMGVNSSAPTIELTQTLFLHYDNPFPSSHYTIMQQRPLLVFPWVPEALAVSVAYGPSPLDTFW